LPARHPGQGFAFIIIITHNNFKYLFNIFIKI